MQTIEELITYKDVIKITKLTRAGIYKRIQNGTFPKPIKLGHGPRSPVRFKVSDIIAFIDSFPPQHY